MNTDELPAEVLERLRRGVPLRLTATGGFRWGSDPVTHARTASALLAGLDVTEAGEPIVRLGPQWCYVAVDDTPLRAISLEVGTDEVTLHLDDGRTVALDPAGLVESPGGGLRCTAPSRHSGRPLGVRLTNRASLDLAEAMVGSETEGYRLRVGGREHRISREDAPSASP